MINPRRFIPYAAYLILIAISLLSSQFNSFHFPLDDSWIHAVYARSFIHGDWFAYNAGQQEAGATSPLWVALSSPLQLLFSISIPAMVLGVKLFTVLLGLCCIYILSRITILLFASELTATIAATLFALDSRLFFSSLSGMENNLTVLLMLLLLYSALKNRARTCAFIAALLPLARPETIFITFFWPLLVGKKLYRLLALLVMGFLPIGQWILFCNSVNGGLLPNTFYIKAVRSKPGLNELYSLIDILQASGLLYSLIFPLGAVAMFLLLFYLPAEKRGKTVLALFAFPVIYLIGVISSRAVYADGFYWTRWLDPPALMLTAFACIGLGALFDKLQKTKRIYAAFLAVFIFICVPQLITTLGERMARLTSDSRAISLLNENAGYWIRENVPKESIVGVNDAGAIHYIANNPTVDLIGLNNSMIATKRLSVIDAINSVDWLAIALVFPPDAVPESVFSKEKQFSIPLQEYTLCPCPAQRKINIYKRRNIT
jgi:hypothetical protein